MDIGAAAAAVAVDGDETVVLALWSSDILVRCAGYE